MEATLVTAGIVCLLAAIVGGRLKGFGFEFPALESKLRQAALGALGLVFLSLAFRDPADGRTSPLPLAAPVVATPVAAPAAVDCERLKSLTSDQESRVTFTNYSNRTVAVYWLNFDGEGAAQFYFNLAPKQKEEMETFISHSWCIRDVSNGVPVQAITIKSQEQDIAIR